MDYLVDGILDEIRKEREAQIKLGHNAVQDDAHKRGQIANTAALFASTESNALYREMLDRSAFAELPIVARPAKGLERRRELVIAAALIVAEIERLERVERTNTEQEWRRAERRLQFQCEPMTFLRQGWARSGVRRPAGFQKLRRDKLNALFDSLSDRDQEGIMAGLECLVREEEQTVPF